MKIAVIGAFQKIHDEEGKARGFEALGHEVFRFEESQLMDNRDILSRFPDLIVFAKLKVDVSLRRELINKAKEKGIPTVCWVPDLYWGLPRQFLIGNDPIFSADLVLTPDGGNDEKWKEKGINHHLLRQGIHREDCYLGTQRPFPEIVMVGTANPAWDYREDLVKFLRQRYGKRFGRYGASNSEHIRGAELNHLYASAKVVVGDSVASPHYWSNRIYETIGRGGFIIHPMTPGLDKEFTPFKHFIPYNFGSFESLAEKIDYFLRHDEERRVIAEAGMEHCVKNHTLTHRCKQLLDICHSMGYIQLEK